MVLTFIGKALLEILYVCSITCVDVSFLVYRKWKIFAQKVILTG